MSTDPADLLERVHDEETFLQVVRALIDSRARDEAGDPDAFGRGPDGWENHSIRGFLEAGMAWAESMGRRQGLGDASVWKRVAVFLYCGKIYE